MKTADEIKKALEVEVPRKFVEPPDKSKGIFGHYIPAQIAIQLANNIFEWDGWNVHVVGTDSELLDDGSRQYTMDVEVIVRSTEGTYGHRIGRGVGTAFGGRSSGGRPPTPQQLDTAKKAAKSDAVKNALAAFGRYLGGELYFDEQQAQHLWDQTEDDEVQQEADKMGPDDKDLPPLGKETPRKKHEPASTEDTIKLWTGDVKPANERVNWPKLVRNDGFQNMIRQGLDPEGKIKDFHAGHRRAVNHYQAHFKVTVPTEITWKMLQALYVRCNDGEQAAAEQFPEYYTPKAEAESVKNVKPAEIPKPKGGVIVIGPGFDQTVPVEVIDAIRKLGITKPDDWLWKMMGETPIGEWTRGHSDAMIKLIEVVEMQDIDKNNFEFLTGMWRLLNDQIRATAG